MKKLIALGLLAFSVSNLALAGVVTVPEIGASTSIGAISLISGAVLILRSRRSK